MTAIMGLLKPKQRLFVEKMSHIVVNDDKYSPDENSSDDYSD